MTNLQDDNNEHSNIKFLYDYTEYHIKLVNDSINVLNTKLSAIIAFSEVMMRFAMDLPNQAFINELPEHCSSLKCYSCLTLKILVCLSLLFSIYKSIKGFFPREAGEMTPPELLMEENREDSEEYCRIIVTKTSLRALEELRSLRDDKAKLFRAAIIALGLAIFLVGTDIILASGLSMLHSDCLSTV